MNKRAQIAIFVIVGILIVTVILFIFLIDRTPRISRGQDLDNPESYIDNCVKEQASIEIDNLIAHAGFPDAQDIVMYKGIAIPYLCKNVNYYQPCIAQYPIYLTQVQKELVTQFSDDVEVCFATLSQELAKRNYIVDAGQITLSAEIKPSITHIGIERQFTISKEGFARTYDRFDVFVNTKLYELASIAQEIVSQEAKFCYFSNDGFMALYNNFDVRKDVLGESTKIYTIENKETSEKMTLAIRGCAIPAGF
ncbi:MAG: hypothetical protein ACP5NS_04675 [Candidatus Pacearchaeota archaeon]